MVQPPLAVTSIKQSQDFVHSPYKLFHLTSIISSHAPLLIGHKISMELNLGFAKLANTSYAV